MRVRLLAGCAVLALALLVSREGAAGFLDDIGDDIGSVFEDDEEGAGATQLDRLKQSASNSRCGGDGAASLLNARVEQGLGVVSDPALSRYLQGVVNKLVAESVPNCRVTVYVTPHAAAQAVALSDGGILVALGFLRNLKNEDEVAALLGHELSHILLDHHSSDSFVTTQDDFLKGMDSANAAGGQLLGFVDPSLGKKLDTVTSVGGAVHGVSESMIAPAWTQEQEDEADLLGTDLIVAAGYNPRAMTAIMEVIEAHEAEAAKVAAEREKLNEESKTGSILETAASTNPTDTWDVVGSLADVATDLLEGEDEPTHRPAAERKEEVSDYIKEHHKKHRRRKYAAEPWEAVFSSGASGATFAHYRMAADARSAIFGGGDAGAAREKADAAVAGRFADHAYPRLAHAEVLLKQGRRDGAVADLEAVMSREDVPWQIYRSYAEIQLGTGDTKGAVRTVESADRLFGAPLGIAPYAIKVHRQAGDQARVTAYLDRCYDSGSRDHLQICLTAAGQDKDSYLAGRLGRGLSN
jgi:predicted Zn-dependent protease